MNISAKDVQEVLLHVMPVEEIELIYLPALVQLDTMRINQQTVHVNKYIKNINKCKIKFIN